MVIIYITGTPGTGKTSLSINLENLFNKKKYENLTYETENNNSINIDEIAKDILNKFQFDSVKYIDITTFIKEQNISEEFDEENNCLIVDLKVLKNKLLKILTNKNTLYLVDSHMTPNFNITPDYQIILKKDISLLRKTLENRGYSKSKIDENIECEIFELNLIDSIENYPNIETLILNIN